MPIGAVRRWERNPRKHPEGQVSRLAALMRHVGFVSPVVVWPSRDRLVAGHGRLDAVELVERETPGHVLPNAPGPGMVRVLFHEFATEADATAFALADNRLPELAEQDQSEVDALARELGETLADMAGFDFDALDDVEEIEAHEIDVSTLDQERFWLSVSGPLPAQPDVLERLRDALEAMPGCAVAFGAA